MTLAQVRSVLDQSDGTFLGDPAECARLDACSSTNDGTASTSSRPAPVSARSKAG
jgi:hypothetical protein